MATTAIPTLQVENDRVRVTEWRFAKGAATGFHRHEFDYVVIPGTTGTLKIVDGDGKETFAELTAGVSYFRNAGVEHDVINASDGEFVFVEVEIKPS
ncbi:MAG: cupin domain-containing protein [Geminicoccaceae bacterium]